MPANQHRLVRLRSSPWGVERRTRNPQQPLAATVTTLPENPLHLAHKTDAHTEARVQSRPPSATSHRQTRLGRRPLETKTSPELSLGKVGSEDRHPSASHRRPAVAHPDEGHDAEFITWSRTKSFLGPRDSYREYGNLVRNATEPRHLHIAKLMMHSRCCIDRCFASKALN
jgi:hypothetical protein